MTDDERDSLRKVGEAILRDGADPARASRAWDLVDEGIQQLAHRVEVAEFRAKALEAVAKNLAQRIELDSGDGILCYNQQLRAHGLKGEA